METGSDGGEQGFADVVAASFAAEVLRPRRYKVVSSPHSGGINEKDAISFQGEKLKQGLSWADIIKKPSVSLAGTSHGPDSSKGSTPVIFQQELKDGEVHLHVPEDCIQRALLGHFSSKCPEKKDITNKAESNPLDVNLKDDQSEPPLAGVDCSGSIPPSLSGHKGLSIPARKKSFKYVWRPKQSSMKFKMLNQSSSGGDSNIPELPLATSENPDITVDPVKVSDEVCGFWESDLLERIDCFNQYETEIINFYSELPTLSVSHCGSDASLQFSLVKVWQEDLFSLLEQ
ncbi:hypothetical protein KI387_035961, partial [Taxus chinensis]